MWVGSFWPVETTHWSQCIRPLCSTTLKRICMIRTIFSLQPLLKWNFLKLHLTKPIHHGKNAYSIRSSPTGLLWNVHSVMYILAIFRSTALPHGTARWVLGYRPCRVHWRFQGYFKRNFWHMHLRVVCVLDLPWQVGFSYLGCRFNEGPRVDISTSSWLVMSSDWSRV